MYLQVYDDLQKRSQEFVSTSELNHNNILQREETLILTLIHFCPIQNPNFSLKIFFN